MLILLILIILSMAVNLRLRYFPKQEKAYDYTAFNREMEGLQNSFAAIQNADEDHIEDISSSTIHPFHFDPNTASESTLRSLGVENRIAGRIMAYRKKGGRFLKKEDLLKIYDFDTGLFYTLLPYIHINRPTYASNKHKSKEHKNFNAHYLIEINSSDTAGLKRIKGVGPVLASRIFKYGQLLGGYYSVDQLKEVYGISDSLLLAIRNYVCIDTALIRKININQASEFQLSRHPYIGRYTAKAVVYYRKSKGNITGLEELVKNNIIPRENENRIKAYLMYVQ